MLGPHICKYVPTTYRNTLLKGIHNSVHLNLAIALFSALIIFVIGIEAAANDESEETNDESEETNDESEETNDEAEVSSYNLVHMYINMGIITLY